MNDTKVIRYFCAGTMTPSETDGCWVTHADYRALEVEHGVVCADLYKLKNDFSVATLEKRRLEKELSSLRGKHTELTFRMDGLEK